MGAVPTQCCVELTHLHWPSMLAHARVEAPASPDLRSPRRSPPCSPPLQAPLHCFFLTEAPSPCAPAALIHRHPWAIIEVKSLYSSSLFPLPLHLLCSLMCLTAPLSSTIIDKQLSQVPRASPSTGLLREPSRPPLRTIQSHPAQYASSIVRTSPWATVSGQGVRPSPPPQPPWRHRVPHQHI
jgi:hypothetical protein